MGSRRNDFNFTDKQKEVVVSEQILTLTRRGIAKRHMVEQTGFTRKTS
jgi:hypothetical protein